MLSCPVLKFKISDYFSLEIFTNSLKIIIGGTATKELDLYENKTALEIE